MSVDYLSTEEIPPCPNCGLELEEGGSYYLTDKGVCGDVFCPECGIAFDLDDLMFQKRREENHAP